MNIVWYAMFWPNFEAQQTYRIVMASLFLVPAELAFSTMKIEQLLAKKTKNLHQKTTMQKMVFDCRSLGAGIQISWGWYTIFWQFSPNFPPSKITAFVWCLAFPYIGIGHVYILDDWWWQGFLKTRFHWIAGKSLRMTFHNMFASTGVNHLPKKWGFWNGCEDEWPFSWELWFKKVE